MREIIPAILVYQYQQFVRALRLVEPYVKTVHLDVMDGVFVDNKTFADARRIGRLKHKLRLGVHMMVAEPARYVEEWAQAGASRYIFHAETLADENEAAGLARFVREQKMEAGAAINPETPVEAVKSYLPELDLVLVMGVKPGWGGQEFQSQALKKISELKSLKPDLLVGVDGGVSLINAQEILTAGADFLVSGTGIYKSKDISGTIKKFQEILAGV